MSVRRKSIFSDGEDAAFPFSLDAASSLTSGAGAHLASAAGEAVLRVEGDDGFGEIRFIEVLPGITVSFNDFRMERCVSSFSTDSDVLCIDWCREGRIEQPMPGGSYAYVSSGDLRSTTGRAIPASSSSHAPVPGGHRLLRPLVRARLDRAGAPRLRRRPFRVERRFCREGRPFLLHASKQASHIASELYLAPVRSRRRTAKSNRSSCFSSWIRRTPACTPTERDTTRARRSPASEAHDLMVSDRFRERHVELGGEDAGMSLTAFKQCFKGVYGSSPAAYVRTVRMELAAKLLRETDRKVAEIGALVGYESPSKFSVAFKDSTGVTPSEYRRRG